ncbi:AbiTii domain-containing protein [Paenibacillus cineris]|uniref:AbiTii domain-containing protein n=1 Tax=Paenibacillus cineris TaxID=237530 RepID=A0ABQ4LN79_9BACL|nr:hypothetical protein [Paenibacillus cineris]GIO57983.1 hypothetical protein J21TS7_63010 [Paenibacillus cineris]
MGRSQLLKDLVSGKESIENVLLRLKVILTDLDNQQIMVWVNGELQGYPNVDDLPDYRILHGTAYGTFLVNYRYQYTNTPVPIDSLLSEELVDEILTVPCTDNIKTIENQYTEVKDNYTYGRIVPTSFCHSISKGELQIASMTVKIAPNLLSEIVATVKSKLVEIVMELEKEYENLDDLDIKTQVESDDSKTQQVVYNIEKIIYGDSVSVEMGDKNKISKSKLGGLLGRGR